jgi:peptidoglycan/xylan/chitin deacetylase (PgdA/CDA1 family)
MDMQRFQESRTAGLLRPVYRAVLVTYRSARAVKNRLSNLVDHPVIILVYHRVAELPSDPELLAVTPANFRLQMEFLKRQFRILRFAEDWSSREGPAVAITFDDGYADNVLEALPILEEAGVPATFFISTGHLGAGHEFWWHQLEAILLRVADFPARFALKDASHGRIWDTATLAQRRQLYASLNLLMQKLDPARRQDWLRQLRIWAGPAKAEESAHRTMSREELKRLSASRWTTIGAHTVNHAALSALTEEQQRHEIFSSKQELENMTGAQITTFSYPFGRKMDFNRTSVRLCREAGFIKAAANFPGQVHRWTDPYQLPRHLVRNWDPETFAAEMKSFWTK